MKTRLIRHYFNMVEIALALAILAIGMSSILVLFPVGINANKSAIADNNLADIAEYLMGYLRAGCAAEWAAKPPNNNFSSGIPVEYTSVKNLGSDGIDLNEYKNVDSETKMQSNNLHHLKGLSPDKKNAVFLYQQLTGDVVDFAAVVRVWREKYSFKAFDASLYNPVDGKINENAYTDITVNPGDSSDPINQYATVFCIEISWPAQAPDSQREKRLFRQEIFNEAYRFP